MANETLSILKDQARMTVIGKSKADTYIDSGLGLDLGDLPSLDLDPFDLNWQIDVPDPENLPDEIRIISSPIKTEYQAGEKIDLSGAIVAAYKNGSIWTSTKYPNGHIPFGELIVDPMVVSGGFENAVNLNGRYIIDNHTGYILTGLVPVNTFVGYEQHGAGSRDPANIIDTYRILPENGAILLFCHFDEKTYTGEQRLYGNFSLLAATDTNPAYHRHYEYNNYVTDNDYSFSKSYTRDGKTVYYGTTGTFGYFFLDLNIVGDYLPIITSSNITVNRQGNADLAWELIYGDKHKGNEIQISWERPSDRNILSTFFNIAIDSNSSGNGGR